jgi:hypothetical protein
VNLLRLPFMKELFPSCSEAARRVSELQEAPLSGPARLGLRLHLAVCMHCRRYARQIRFLHTYLNQYPDHLSRLCLPDSARSEIVRKLMAQP